MSKDYGSAQYAYLHLSHRNVVSCSQPIKHLVLVSQPSLNDQEMAPYAREKEINRTRNRSLILRDQLQAKFLAKNH